MKVLKQFLSSLFLGANILVVLAFWAICLSSYVSPANFPSLSTMGLAFPVFAVVNILFVVFWLIFKIRHVWIPLVGLGCMVSYIWDYCPLNMSKDEEPENAIKVITFNVGRTLSEDDRQKTIEYLNEANADVICLQEAYANWAQRADFKKLLKSRNYHYVYNQGEYIITRFDVVGDSIPLRYFTSSGHTFVHRFRHQEDTILIINNHLESNKLKDEDKAEFKDMIKRPRKDKIEKKGNELVNYLTEAAAIRSVQVDSLCQFVEKNKGKSIILCGDLNDTPISYTYQKISRELNSVFRKKGNGVGTTFNEKGFWVRIDHAFVSDDWTIHAAYVEKKIITSDHYPLVFSLTKK